MALGFGIIGCGMISRFHARAIADVRGAKLVADMGLHVLQTRVHALQQLAFRRGSEFAAGYPAQRDERGHHQWQHQEQQF